MRCLIFIEDRDRIFFGEKLALVPQVPPPPFPAFLLKHLSPPPAPLLSLQRKAIVPWSLTKLVASSG
jgi:hypothetical protein